MKKDVTIQRIVRDDLCHGCGACVALCPRTAISMTIDERRGIYRPFVDMQLCDECGICLQVCPGHEIDMPGFNMSLFSAEPEDKILGYYRSCSTGYATDNDLRFNSASGGLVSALLAFALEEGLIDGALVTRMSDDNPLLPYPFIARTREEIIAAARSKYCPVPADIALKEILESKGKYAVVGLPCHIHGIRKAEELRKDLKDRIAMHVGIFCGHVPGFNATKFLLQRRGIPEEAVRSIDYRGYGWPGGITIRLKNDKKVFIPHFEAFKTLDVAFVPRRCLLCCDGANELADISFGDAWLDEFAGDSRGTSIAIARTQPGAHILETLKTKGIVAMSDIMPEKVRQSQQDFRAKKVFIRVYRTYARLAGQKIPVCYSVYGKLRSSDIVNATLRWLGLLLSSRRWLWKFIPLLPEKIIPCLGAIQRFLKRQPPASPVRH